ncbi:peroxiredoxin-2E-1, chloroplastic [Primulina eburnea]|uniref:peroxiredoxin-2E-1, chloroplastic n=1 Tax=Primulina eburnea TaxID=1245227 RepID=UPI003C6BDC55
MAASAATTASIAIAKLFTPSSSKFKQPLCAFSQFKTPTSLFSSSFAALPLHPHRRTRPQYLRFSTAPKISAAISVGDKLPDATLSYFDSSDELQTISISDLTAKKKTILIAVPGAFTPTCSQKHLPGFVEKAAEFKAKGVDTIACISVNDAFVMKAWKENLQVGDEVLLLSDGNGDFTKAIGCELDLSDKPVGLGVRSRRYAIYLEDGVVKILNLEEGGAFNVSSAEDMLKAL